MWGSDGILGVGCLQIWGEQGEIGCVRNAWGRREDEGRLHFMPFRKIQTYISCEFMEYEFKSELVKDERMLLAYA